MPRPRESRVPNRRLGVNHRIDDRALAIGGALDGVCGPLEPARVSRHDVEKDVGVNEHSRHSVIACQRHDGVGAHRDIAAAPHTGDEASPRPPALARTMRTTSPSNPNPPSV